MLANTLDAKAGYPLLPYVEAEDLLRAVVHLLARNPHLAEHLLDLLASHEVRDESFSLFHHLFVGAAREAVVAKDYRVSYRLRASKEGDLTSSAVDADSVIFGSHGNGFLDRDTPAE
jgi:hypothetical protein